MTGRSLSCLGKRVAASFAAVAITLTLCTGLAHPQATFNKQTFQTGLNPQSIVSEDFDGDGLKDVAIALYDDRSLEIRYGQSNGTFSDGIQVPLCGFAKKVLTTRLNADNIPDLVVLADEANAENCGDLVLNPLIELVLSNPGGTPTVAHFKLPKHAIDVAVGDLNGDGVFDVAALAEDESVMTILVNRDHPESSIQNYTVADVAEPLARSLALADFNFDGKAELVMSACCIGGDNAEGAIYVMNGNGDGTFSSSATTVDTHPATELVRADLNNDANPDIIATLQDCPPKTACNSAVAAYLDQKKLRDQPLTFLKINAWSSATSNNAYIGPHSPVVGQFTDDGPSTANQHDDIAFLVTDERFETGGEFLFVVPIFSNNTVASPVKYFLGFEQGAQSLAWAKIPGTSSLADLVDVNANFNTFDALTNTSNETRGLICSPPDNIGVNVCRPASGATSSSPLHVLAAASVLNRTYRLEVWEGATKLATARDIYLLDATLSLPNGSHTLTFVARNADNTSRASRSVSFTVGDCAVPAGNGINTCSPADGSTVSNPVPIEATAKVSGAVYRFELWIDAAKYVTVRDNNVMNTSLTLPAGMHRFDFVAYNADRSSRVTKTVRVTVR